MSGNSTTLFSKQRDYAHVAAIERDFFIKLAAQKGQFAGRSPTVTKAVHTSLDFVQRDTRLDVVVEFEVSGQRSNVDHMYLGTLLVPHSDPKERQVTHFMALTKGEACEMRLHVDLDFDLSSPEPKPSPHMQFGGRLMIAGKSFEIKWDKALDKPRWPCLPFCTPLVWHAAFLEFQDCASVATFVRKSWWTNLVQEAESAIWGPFAKDISAGVSKQQCIINALYPPAKRK